MSSRIAMFSYHTCPLASQEGKETGGMNVYVLELSKELAAQGYIVDVFTRSQDREATKVVKVAKNLRVIHVVAGPEESVPKKTLLQYVPEFVDRIHKLIKEEELEYSVFHCHYYMSGLAGVELRNKLGTHIPIVMTFHTLALMKNLVARTESEREDEVRSEIEFQLVKEAEHIIVPSENDQAYLQYLYQASVSKMSIISPGVNVQLFHPIDQKRAKKEVDADPDHKVVLFAGRIEPLKGIDGLMYAMKIIMARNPSLHVCLWVVGGDISQSPALWSNELQRLEQVRQMLNMSSTVKFVGQQPQNRLPYYYNAAEVVVMPSHYESFGMAAAEAMACGVPVIMTNVSGIAGILDEKHEKLVTSVNNPLLLADQIEQLIEDEKWHTQIRKEVMTKVQDLSWQNVAKQVGNVYNKLQ